MISFRSSLSLTLIISLRLDVGFGFALNFFAGSIRIVLLFFFVLILLLGFQFLMEFVFHHKLEFFLLGCLICKVSNKGK